MKTLPPLSLSDPWTWLRQVSRVKMCQSQTRTPPDLPGSVVDSSGISYEPFAWWDRRALCWRTWQSCLIEGWARYSARFPRSGMTRNGIAYRRAPLVPLRNETASGLLPTLPKSEPRDCSQARILARLDKGGRVARRICSTSPQARLMTEIVTLNPSFAEWLAGFPTGWTELDRAETALTPQSPNS